ncbi:hypothetical protein [Georgenia muralis]|uniref:Uncharacterized protein n=1 Tax=Georgenia muralis TaxID=154117 RepID=A0A3N4Z4Y7_9MICO|nr:hypothetical protein [Georgenia muralis]RPF26806.1 hypothetical protein EDD32_1263 [Georgenia muralis]
MAIDQIPLRDAAVSLGPEQHGYPVTTPDHPIEVAAWVHTRLGHRQVTAEAVAWTPRAARIRYLDEHGRQGFAWVWASAVQRR